jgi:hypothetical protein
VEPKQKLNRDIHERVISCLLFEIITLRRVIVENILHIIIYFYYFYPPLSLLCLLLFTLILLVMVL